MYSSIIHDNYTLWSRKRCGKQQLDRRALSKENQGLRLDDTHHISLKVIQKEILHI